MGVGAEPKKKTADRNEIVIYLIKTYFDNNINDAVTASEFTKQQIESWVNRKKTPHPANVGKLMHLALAPEFKVIFEYAPIETSGAEVTVRQQISTKLGKNLKVSGIYAFYDSMANLIYIGKSDGNLFEEICTQLKAKLQKGTFPKGAKQPGTRLDLVRYISAYFVQSSDFQDYAKHVESLILRISKPVLNANIGHLKKIIHT